MDLRVSAWALLPLELVRQRGQTMFTVEYKGGEWLDGLVRQPMDIGQFLRVAVALSSAVGQLHGRGLIHQDIKPASSLAREEKSSSWGDRDGGTASGTTACEKWLIF